MSEECRNDCVEPFEFPKKINNRPGLSHIDYRIGTYADFREAMFRKLNQNEVLKNWTHRESDDPGIALLEGVAVLGDILTFYQELYANEAYLRTAQWRESIADLVRLLGYQLSPGVGGKATFALTFKGDKSIVVPAQFPLKAQLETLEKPVDFETLAETVAYPELSQFHLYRPYTLTKIATGTNAFSIETEILKQNKIELNQGDRLLLVVDPAQPDTIRQIVTIQEIKERFDRTEIKIEGSLQGELTEESIHAYKLGRSFRHFGHNSPPSFVTASGDRAMTKFVPFDRQLDRAIAVFKKVVFADEKFYKSYPVAKYKKATPEKQLVNPNFQKKQNLKLSDKADIPFLLYRRMPLDTEVEDLAVGATFIVQLNLSDEKPDRLAHPATTSKYFFERQITAISQTSLTWGAVTAGTTVVEIDKPISSGKLIYTDIRSIEFLEAIGEKFQLQGAYQEESIKKPNSIFKKIVSKKVADRANLLFRLSAGSLKIGIKKLLYFGNAQNYKHLDGRMLAFVKKDGTSEILTVTLGDENQTDDNRLKFRPVYLSNFSKDFSIADFPLLDEPKVTVYGNLVEANQGKTEREAVLGNGDSRQKFQTFKLPKAPLTYHNLPGETPPEVPELQIYVSDRLWQQVPTFFDRKPDEEIYIVREDANGDSWVQFGDGKTGKQLPSGIKNVVAKYRTGIGAYGALKSETKVQASGRLDRLDKIYLPGIVTGGAEPESGDNAKEAAPGKIQSLDRLVSLQDFESETLTIPGVSKALAAWELVDYIPSVAVTVLMETGRTQEFKEVEKILSNYNRCRGSQRFPIAVLQGKRKYVSIAANVAFDPTFRPELVENAIHTALGVLGENDGLFSSKNRRFGQPEYTTRIAGTIQNVEGVLWVEVAGLISLGEADDPAELSRPDAIALNSKIACTPQQILSLYPAHLQLSPVSPPSSKPC